jgi:hypothetical protein
LSEHAKPSALAANLHEFEGCKHLRQLLLQLPYPFLQLAILVRQSALLLVFGSHQLPHVLHVLHHSFRLPWQSGFRGRAADAGFPLAL